MLRIHVEVEGEVQEVIQRGERDREDGRNAGAGLRQ